MVLRSDAPIAAQHPAAEREGMSQVGAAMQQPALLVRAALRFASRRHARQRRDSDGAPFIEHPMEVARLLRDVGCREVVIAAGLLHDVLENTAATARELTARFGTEVTTLVQAVSDDASVEDYRERKQLLRDQVEDADGDALLIFAADKISKVRELSHTLKGRRARLAVTTPDGLQHDVRLRLEHYQESLRMLQRRAAWHPLVACLAHELDTCLTATAAR
jgi:(p)ppGpp synthase/HD superfamily hydrolase